MRSSVLFFALMAILGACTVSVSAQGWCDALPRDINLGGQTLERTFATNARECCQKCQQKGGCKGYNWCSYEGCDGGAPRGSCDLKFWNDWDKPEAWGCSGPQQMWKSGIAYGDQPATPPPCGGNPIPPPPPVEEFRDCPGCFRQNWAGRVVTLSVDSWKMGEGGNHGSPYISSPEACSRACTGRTMNGITANAFSFCDRREGCGSWCEQFRYMTGTACGDKNNGQNEVCFGPFAQYGSNDFGGRIQPGCINDRFRFATCSCKRIDENSGAPPTLVDGTVEWISGRAPLPVMQPRGL